MTREAVLPGRSAESGDVSLNWSLLDIEQRIGFRGGRFTRVNNRLSFLVALLCTVAFFVLLLFVPDSYLAVLFTQRGPTQYAACFLAFWSAAILFVKWKKLRLQRLALNYEAVPLEHDFVLTPLTARQVTERIYGIADEPQQFVLLHRILVALSNLENLGRVSEVDDILRSEAENETEIMETSYSLLNGFVWAIPVFGFIGTVLGLSQAIGAFGGVLGSAEDLSQITGSLRLVTAGLATAFDTTLVALVFAVAIQLTITFLRKSEEEFLGECSDYCLRRVVGRLKLMPYENERE